MTTHEANNVTIAFWHIPREHNKLADSLAKAAAVYGDEASTNPPYKDAEKSFLKINWHDEYHFLLQHGLKIHQAEDRAEGRLILRALMHEDRLGGEPLNEEGSHGEFKDDRSDFAGRQAVDNFSYEELEWIETHYGNCERFMKSHGLKFYDYGDVERAKLIVNAILDEEY